MSTRRKQVNIIMDKVQGKQMKKTQNKNSFHMDKRLYAKMKINSVND